MRTKMCIGCSVVKIMPVDFDVDDHDMTGYTAKCKECLGTLPSKPVSQKKRRKPSKRVTIQEEPVEVPIVAVDEVDSVPVPVVVPADEYIEDGD